MTYEMTEEERLSQDEKYKDIPMAISTSLHEALKIVETDLSKVKRRPCGGEYPTYEILLPSAIRIVIEL